ncbi:glycosyltransferase family 4 protein [Vibrio cyclitrophicus]|uniref:glycosyltransferase family 4 protein n=1 Tax=Vibrio cyclitrophicus TaxID=47951 RepID=UPI0032E4B37E
MRFFNYISFLKEHNFRYSSLFDDKYIDKIYSGQGESILGVFFYYLYRLINVVKVCFNRDVSIVWIEKELFPYIPIPLEIVFNLCGKKVVYDYDDAIFHNYDKFWLIYKIKFIFIARSASVIFSGNEYISSFFTGLGAKNIALIPTVVDIIHYDNTNDITHNNDEFNIVWIGTPNTQKYLQNLDIAFNKLQTKYSNVRVNLIGASLSVPLTCRYQILDWNSSTEVRDIKKMDVGVMPLPDLKFERGKCGYKIIQYQACKLPVLASPVGVNVDIISHGVNGFLCSSSDDWFKYLEKLLNNRETALRMGLIGYKKINHKYTYQKVSKKISQTLFDLKNK